MKLKHLIILVASLTVFSCANNKPKSSGTYTSTSVSKSRGTTEGNAIVKEAKKYIGTKYKYGGIDKRGLDCSGLIYTVYKDLGKPMPRVSSEQAKKGKAVYIGELQTGDLIFFGAKKGSKKITHAGIVSYTDGKVVKVIHSSSSKGVIEVDVANYWMDKYIKARRVL